ncbi:MAG: homogentisate phytyltransferase [Cyanobacteria bacterium CRU_2_1]|nr:homogentisate phytyltransferase [Cyanobacteria bacterium RU_5_0]NJR58329.1 homogentisate phytyltransferase [Cyanobacteria bacterium CRU_2_1]
MSQILPPKPPLPSSHSPQRNLTQSPFSWLHAFWKFSRPHTIIGTSLSILGLYLIALSENGGWKILSPLTSHPSSFILHLSFFILPLLTCLCGNIYIVGLNQIEDVEIDRINKPHLPLASGEFSRRQGWAIVATTGILAIVLSAMQGYFLMGTVWLSLLIGTAYSLPPIRLRRFPVWASLCIFSVRGAIVNLGLFLHFNQQLHLPSSLHLPSTFHLPIPSSVWALALFILIFTFAIAIFKDIPDLEGDRLYHITTFTVRLGQKAVFNLARSVLTVCYLGMILAGLWLPDINSAFLVITHLLALGALWIMSLKVDLPNKTSIARFYQVIWKLFFLEYLIVPIACLLK